MKAVLAKKENTADQNRIEYFRNAAALVPDASDNDPGVAIMVCSEKKPDIHFSCGCRMYRKKKNCRHIGEISAMSARQTASVLTGGSAKAWRWWNAAREDQATDRVHRIGQERGVQVFKLVTEGTLEEKISAIIDLKKQLMKEIVAEDDPGLLKAFSPEDLIDLLSPPDPVRSVSD